MSARKTVLSLAVGVLVFSFAAQAQVSTASVNGTIRDVTGSLVPDTSLVLRNVDTNVEMRANSNAAGNYAFLNVPVGRYTIEASKAGFSTNRVETFTLTVNQTATFNVSLNVGSTQQSVTVEAVGDQVESSTAELGAVIGTKTVQDLPLNGRNFTQLLNLTPGMSPSNPTAASGGSGSSPVGAYSFPVVNGQTGRSSFYMLDGINDLGGWSQGIYAIAPIVDAIQEFKVQTHNDEAEFGGVQGGIINVVTKSGTNQLHGSGWEFLRNNVFDARNFFQATVTPYRWNQFGASGGGPVVIPKLYDGKNKTFFFLAYEGYRLRQPANTYLRVPTAANLAGDLSDQPNPIYNPFSTQPDPSHPGQFIRTLFPNNQIPANLIDPGLVAFAKATLPAPNFSGIANYNVLDTTPGATNQEEYSARVDQIIGPKDSVWFRWSGTLNSQTSSGGRPELQYSNDVTGKNIGANWVHTFSPTSVLDAQFGYMWVDWGTQTRYRSLPAGLAQQVGFADNFVSGFHNVGTLFPNISVANYFNGGESAEINSPWSDVWQEKANYTKIIGSHTLKMGADINQTRYAGAMLNDNVGFTSFETANPASPGNSGSALASFLLDVPNNASRRNTLESTSWGAVMGLYFQDQWKATSNLTINVGLRYDRRWQPTYGRPQDGNQYVGDADLLTGTYILQKQPGSCDQLQKPPCIPTPGGVLPQHVVLADNGKVNHDSLLDFGPRFGMAYRLDANTALRGGFGIFYDEWAAYQQSSQNMQGTWPSVDQQFANNLNSPQSGTPTPTVTAKNPIPSSTFPSPDPFSTFTWYFDPYMKPGYSLQWNFGIQHQFGTNTVATVNYVGSGSRRQPLSSVYNTALTPGPGNPQSRSQFPYAGIDYFDRSWGRSNYEALQAMVQKRISSGLSYTASYTWSKTTSIGCDGWYGFEGCSVQDPYHFNNDRSVAVSDVPQLFAASWLYELPIGSGKRFKTGNRVVDYLVGNWQVNGILSLQSGEPYNIYISSDIANVGILGSDQGERPNLVGNPTLSNPKPTAWFNIAAFQAPAPFTFGNLGRNTGRTDWGRNLDLSLFRQFPFKETRRLEFRADAFNLTNTPVFAGPHADMNDPAFGQVTSTRNTERLLQLALKIIF